MGCGQGAVGSCVPDGPLDGHWKAGVPKVPKQSKCQDIPSTCPASNLMFTLHLLLFQVGLASVFFFPLLFCKVLPSSPILDCFPNILLSFYLPFVFIPNGFEALNTRSAASQDSNIPVLIAASGVHFD